MDLIEGRLRLGDGRRLAFRDQGDRRGRAVVLCHGWPGSRLQGPPDPGLPARLGLRLVTLDRPGFGRSSFQPGRRLIDWPADLAALADGLGLDRFTLIGVSGGGPYALAAAALLPERVDRLGLISSLAQLDRAGGPGRLYPPVWLGFRLAASCPPLFRLILSLFRLFLASGRDRASNLILGRLLPADRPVLARDEVRGMFAADVREAFRSGPAGPAWDLGLLARPWGFDPAALRVRTWLWHGTADKVVPCSHGRYLSQVIPGCRPEFVPGAGHFFAFERLAGILAELLAG